MLCCWEKLWWCSPGWSHTKKWPHLCTLRDFIRSDEVPHTSWKQHLIAPLQKRRPAHFTGCWATKDEGLERCRGSLIPEQMEDKCFIYYMENWLTSICTLTGIYLFTSVFCSWNGTHQLLMVMLLNHGCIQLDLTQFAKGLTQNVERKLVHASIHGFILA
jgi:hypothetical protein